MKAWINKLGGILLASLLTVMLNGKAYAEEKPEGAGIEASTPAAADSGLDNAVVSSGDAGTGSVVVDMGSGAAGEGSGNFDAGFGIANEDSGDTGAGSGIVDMGSGNTDAGLDNSGADSDDAGMGLGVAGEGFCDADAGSGETGAGLGNAGMGAGGVDTGSADADPDDPAADGTLTDGIELLLTQADVPEDPKNPVSPSDDAANAPLETLTLIVEPKQLSKEFQGNASAPMEFTNLFSAPADAMITVTAVDEDDKEQPGEPAEKKNDTPVLLGTAAKSAELQPEEKGKYILVNNQSGGNITADDSITILAAGLNHIGSVSIPDDGTVTIAGTGILLVDSLKGNTELLTFTDIYSEGSVAVFVKQDNDQYLLINGCVPGILDEEYTITEDVTLVMPDQTKLLLCGTGAAPRNDGSGLVYYHGNDVDSNKVSDVSESESAESVGKLTIAEQAALIVREGASIVLENLKSLIKVEGHEQIRNAELIVEGGTLTVDGTVGGDGDVTLFSESNLSGDGSIASAKVKVFDAGALQNSQVVFSSSEVYLNNDYTYENVIIHDSSVHLFTGGSISGLTSSGCSTVVGGTNLSISKVEGTLSLNSGGITPHTVSGNMAGSGTICFERGVYIIPKGTVMNGVKISTDSWGEIFDYAGALNTSSYIPLRTGPTSVTTANQNNGVIPVAAAALSYVDNVVVESSIFETKNITAIDSDGKMVLKWDDIQALIDAYRETSGCSWNAAVQLLCYNGEVLSLEDPDKRIASSSTESGSTGSDTEEGQGQESSGGDSNDPESGNTQSPKLILAGDVCLVRIFFERNESSVLPASNGTQTSTTYTGSGILGGSNAGSVTIGQGTTSNSTGGDNNNSNSSGGNNGGDNNSSNDTGGDNSGSNTGNNTNGNTTNTTTNPEPAPLAAYVDEDPAASPLIWVEEASGVGEKTTDTADTHNSEETKAEVETTYVLLALEGEKTLEDLGGKAAVSMSYTPPAEYKGKTLYVVFRDENNKLVAFRATYSDTEHLLRFITDRLGEFMVVGFDFDSAEFEEFSPEFYKALAKLPELENLIFSKVSPV